MRILSFIAVALASFTANAAVLGTQTADVVDDSQATVSASGATLIREDGLFRIRINTHDLDPTHLYILIGFVFNDPSKCASTDCSFETDSNALGGNTAVTSTGVVLTGGQPEASGDATFIGKLEKGAVGLSGRQVLEGTGVYNMAGAQVQVLIRDMGPSGHNGTDPFKQVTDYLAGCGSFTCQPVQFVTFGAP